MVYLKKEGHQIVAYVIMPNHIHLMLAYKENTKSINTLVGNGKRLLSYGIVSRLKEQTQTELLTQLTQSISLSKKKTRSKAQNIMTHSTCNTVTVKKLFFKN